VAAPDPNVAAVGPLTDAERYAFDVRGYLVRRRVLGPEEVAALQRAVDRLALPPPGDGILSQRFKDFLHTDPAFVALLDHPAVLPVLTELCGGGVRLDHAYGLVMDQGQSGLGLHGGGTPFDHAQFYVVAGGAISCGLVAVHWALVDQPAGLGGFCCVPGSHKAAFPVPTGADLGPLVQEVPLAAGDVVLFTEALTHGTLPWRAGWQRRALFYKYSPGSSSWGRDEVYDRRLWRQLSRRQRLLFEGAYVYRREWVADA
jgi:Phytanoyl-CoA dioxygenase (PhyH)